MGVAVHDLGHGWNRAFHRLTDQQMVMGMFINIGYAMEGHALTRLPDGPFFEGLEIESVYERLLLTHLFYLRHVHGAEDFGIDLSLEADRVLPFVREHMPPVPMDAERVEPRRLLSSQPVPLAVMEKSVQFFANDRHLFQRFAENAFVSLVESVFLFAGRQDQWQSFLPGGIREILPKLANQPKNIDLAALRGQMTREDDTRGDEEVFSIRRIFRTLFEAFYFPRNS